MSYVFEYGYVGGRVDWTRLSLSGPRTNHLDTIQDNLIVTRIDLSVEIFWQQPDNI